MSEVVLIEFIGNAKSGVAAANEQVAANKEVEASAKKASESQVAASSSATKSMAANGAAMSKVGKSMTRYVSLPLIGIGAVATKMSLDFSKAMLLIETHTDTSRKSVELYRKTILEMSSSGKFTQGPKELAEAMYHIASDGYKGAKALATLKESAHLATLGQSNLAETTYALVSAQKTAIRGTENLHETIGTLNGIVGAGDMKMQDLVGAMSTGILPAAKSAGLSLKDVGAALDVLTQRGVPAQQGAYRLAMTFQMMIPHTEKALGEFEALGLKQDDLANKLHGPHGLLDALILLKEHLSDLSKPQQQVAIEEMFGGGRTSRGILTLIQNLGGLSDSYKSINNLAGETNKNLKAALESPVNVWAKQWAALQAALVEVGNELVPVVIPAMKAIASDVTGLAKGFEALPKGTQEWAIKLGVLGIALGPVLRMVGGLTKGLSSVGSLGAKVVGAVAPTVGIGGADAGAGVAGAGAAALASQPEILAAAAAVAALSAGLIVLYHNSKTFREEVGELGSAVSEAAGEIKAQVDPLIHSFGHLAHAFSSLPIVKQIEALHISLDRFSGFFHSAFVETIRSGFKTVSGELKGLGQIFAGSVQVISGLVNLMADLLEGKFGKAWHAVENIFQAGAKIALGAVKFMSAPLVAAVELQGKVMHALFGGMWDGIVGIFKSGINDAIGLVNDMIGLIDKLPFIDIGKIGEIGGGRNFGNLEGENRRGSTKLHHQHRARGGPIHEGAPSGDTVPALLERGEYVLNKKAVAKVGRGKLDQINFHEAPRFSIGGALGTVAGEAVSTVGGAARGVLGDAASVGLGALPNPDTVLPNWLSGFGSYLEKEAVAWVKGQKKKSPAVGPTSGPSGTSMFDGKPVAKWIIPELLWAMKHGWQGTVTSGWRDPSQVVTGTFATAPQGQSEHQYTQYPGGAVDVSEYEQFARIIAGYPGKRKLIQLGIDPLHFSGTGHKLGGLIGMAAGGLSGDQATIRKHVMHEIAQASKGWRALGWKGERLKNWAEVWNELPRETRLFNKSATQKWLGNKLPTNWRINQFDQVLPGSPRPNEPVLAAGGGPIEKLAGGGGVSIVHPKWEDEFREWMDGVWGKARHLYGATGPPPPLFLARGLRGQLGDVGLEKSGTVEMAPGDARRAMNGAPFAQETLLHEWAHVFQKSGLKHWEKEGGATDFARWAGPQVFPGIGDVPYPIGYKGYAKAVESKRGMDWIKRGQFMASGGVVGAVGSILMRNGLDIDSAAGILGNAYGESSWNPASVGSGGGGLWGFTASPNSLSDLQAYASAQGASWTDAGLQTQFMLHHLSGGLKSQLNAASSTDDTTSLFMHEWERPLNYDSLGVRQGAAKKALATLKGLGGSAGTAVKEVAKQITGKYGPKAGSTGKGGGTNAPPGKYKVQTSALSFGSTAPGTIAGCRKELRERRAELTEYKAAIRDTKDAPTKRALESNAKAIKKRIKELLQTISKLLTERKQKAQAKRIEGRGLFPAVEDAIASRERAYEESSEYAEQVTALEPEENAAGYIAGKETSAWQQVLATEGNWRNALISGEDAVGVRERSIEAQIESIQALKITHPEAYGKQKKKLPALRNALSATRTLYSPVTARSYADLVAGNYIPAAGSFEESLVSLQGQGKSRSLLPSLPGKAEAGSFGGLIFDTQRTIEELGLKTSQVGESPDNSALLEAEKALAEQARRGQLLAELQYGPLSEFLKKMPPYIGAFAKGGPITADGMAMVHKGEYVVPANDVGKSSPTYFTLHLHGDMANAVDSAMPGMVKEVDRQMGTKYRQVVYGPGARR